MKETIYTDETDKHHEDCKIPTVQLRAIHKQQAERSGRKQAVVLKRLDVGRGLFVQHEKGKTLIETVLVPCQVLTPAGETMPVHA